MTPPTLLSLSPDPPPGFECRPGLTRAELRAAPFALFVDDPSDARLLLSGIEEKVAGIVLHPGPGFFFERLGPMLCRIRIPRERRIDAADLASSQLSLLAELQEAVDRNKTLALENARGTEDRARLAADFDRSRKMLIAEIAERRRTEEAHRESEEKYRLLIDTAHDAIFIVQDGVIKFPNRRLTEITGFATEEAEGQPFLQNVHPDDQALVADRHRRRIAGEAVLDRYVIRIVAKSGETIWVEVAVAPIEWEGRPATLTFLRDVTRQKMLEEELLHARKMEAVGTLAGGVAHDFNNILQAIIGFAALSLQEIGPGDPHGENLLHIKKAAERAAELVRRLLAFSRQRRPESKPTDLNQVVAQAFHLLERTFPKMIRVELSLGESNPVILADATQIEQVVMNLAVNARDAMPEGGVISVSTDVWKLGPDGPNRPDDLSTGAFAVLSIRDTGSGMDQVTQARMFDPFFTTKGIGAGTGLGLATVYGIVREHSGLITCESEKGKGTVFDVFLPIVTKDGCLPEGPTHEKPTVSGGSERILLVDDDELLRTLGKTILSRVGYEVMLASSGEEALKVAAETGGFDLVVLDLGMPGMGGEKCLAELKKADSLTKVLVVSGYAELKSREMMDGGASGYLSKPYSPADLLRSVREILGDHAKNSHTERL